MRNDASRFADSLKASLSQWARQVGFGYHHAEPSYVMLVHWIPQTPPTISDNASHQAGVVAFVFNEEGEVLVVQEMCGPYKDFGLWKMPTGRINQGEGIKEGAVREVQEETGINTEFVQVVGFRDGHNTPFGKSDLLFVCMLRSLSSNIVVQDTKISAAKWMAMEEFASQPNLNQRVCCQCQRTM
ncbi:nudix hydrolase 2-like [Cryptomeria japonica]|uniref:nudix hydrolase 2-like n=1 Tax=Cryptomeria japonica TaxID=3369 RepID=UPI0027DA0D9E|nr:nudix hydrolase 2-like [Cryptomeria japonica]